MLEELININLISSTDIIDLDVISNNHIISINAVAEESIDLGVIGTILNNISNENYEQTNFELIFLTTLLL